MYSFDVLLITNRMLSSIEEKDELAPYVVSFSSRGPNPITSDILKVILVNLYFLHNATSYFLILTS